MRCTGSNSIRGSHNEEPPTGNAESTGHTVVAFRSRPSENGSRDLPRESADRVSEVEDPAIVHAPGLEGGEVLLW
jgi:hypothetical protein